MKVYQQIRNLLYETSKNSHYAPRAIYLGTYQVAVLEKEMEKYGLYDTDSITLRTEFDGIPVYIVDTVNYIGVGYH